jgi:energy-coupling factor transport system substrate-specific component
MSTTENRFGRNRFGRNRFGRNSARRNSTGAAAALRPATLIGVAACVLAGLLIWAVGLPGTGSVFGTQVSTLTVPLALAVALTGVSVVGAVTFTDRWRVVDMVVAGVLGVVGGFFFWGVATVWTPLTEALKLAPPASALLAGLWLVPGVLGGLVIRKPGAAVYVELVAAVLEALLGNQWGFSTVYYGLIEGLGAEFVLALLLYRTFTLVPAVLAGAGAGVAVGLLDTGVYYTDLTSGTKSGYVVLAVLSGAVIAGAGAWALTRALASTGALAPLASGRTAERV